MREKSCPEEPVIKHGELSPAVVEGDFFTLSHQPNRYTAELLVLVQTGMNFDPATFFGVELPISFRDIR